MNEIELIKLELQHTNEVLTKARKDSKFWQNIADEKYRGLSKLYIKNCKLEGSIYRYKLVAIISVIALLISLYYV